MTEFRLTVSAHEHDSEPTNVGEVRITDLSFLLTVLLENQKHGASACLGGVAISHANVWNVVQVHRTLSFLGSGHTIILSSSLQENVRSLLPVNLRRNNILTARRNQC